MREQVLKLSGWKTLRKGLIDFRQCPGCGYLAQEIWLEENDQAKCFQCNHNFPLADFKATQREETIGICAECGEDVPFTDYFRSLSTDGYLCSCDNYVAIIFDGEPLHPEQILKPSWSEDLSSRNRQLKRKCFTVRCQTEKDWQVIRILQILAKQTNREFRFYNDTSQALLVFDLSAKLYVGYLMWFEQKESLLLSQLFIVPSQQRRSYGEALVKYWVEEYADKVGPTFALEDPNDQALALHLKLGHVRKEGDNYIGVRCRFVSGL